MVLVETEVHQEDRVPYPWTDLHRLVLDGVLGHEPHPFRSVRADADERGHLHPGRRMVRPGRRVDVREGGTQSYHRGVLNEEILEACELRAEAVPRGTPQLGEAVRDALVEEFHQFRGESVVEAGVAVEGLGGLLVVNEPQLFEGALEVDAGLEGDGPEEGHWVDLAMAFDEAALLGEVLQNLGGEQLQECVLEERRRRASRHR